METQFNSSCMYTIAEYLALPLAWKFYFTVSQFMFAKQTIKFQVSIWYVPLNFSIKYVCSTSHGNGNHPITGTVFTESYDKVTKVITIHGEAFTIFKTNMQKDALDVQNHNTIMYKDYHQVSIILCLTGTSTHFVLKMLIPNTLHIENLEPNC